jgi:hypothetical protein
MGMAVAGWGGDDATDGSGRSWYFLRGHEGRSELCNTESGGDECPLGMSLRCLAMRVDPGRCRSGLVRLMRWMMTSPSQYLTPGDADAMRSIRRFAFAHRSLSMRSKMRSADPVAFMRSP